MINFVEYTLSATIENRAYYDRESPSLQYKHESVSLCRSYIQLLDVQKVAMHINIEIR